jgi:hypothetical protein
MVEVWRQHQDSLGGGGKLRHAADDEFGGRIEVVGRAEEEQRRGDVRPIGLCRDHLLVKLQSVFGAHATGAAGQSPEILIEIAAAAHRGAGRFDARIDGREDGAAPTHRMAFDAELLDIHLRLLFQHRQGPPRGHGDEIPAAVQQVRLLVERVRIAADGVVMVQAFVLAQKTSRQAIPIRVWRLGLLQDLAAPVDADGGVAQLYPIRHAPLVGALPATVYVDDTRHLLAILRQAKIGRDPGRGAAIAAGQLAQVIAQQLIASVFVLPCLDDFLVQGLLTSVVGVPEVGHRTGDQREGEGKENGQIIHWDPVD